MIVERDFHMAKGDGEASYAKNSKLQRNAIIQTKPVLDEAVKELSMGLLCPTMTVCDLGCSSGENTLLFAANVIEVIGCSRNKLGGNPVELQFFHNDLAGNDFNLIFQSLEKFKKSVIVACNGETPPPFYIAGLPGSYYARLFPRQSVHLFHSSYCLHWHSQILVGIEGDAKAYLNEGNIYITKTTPASTVKLYREQFQNDMLMFLKMRYEELVPAGQMVLTFLGRKTEDVYNGDMNHLWGLLAQSMQSLVKEGYMEEKQFDSFSLPIDGPSLNEVKDVIKQTTLFDIKHISLFESNWDSYDDSEGDVVQDNIQSGINVAKTIRAAIEPMLANHFGESVIDALFKKYAYNVAEHLKVEKTKFSVILLALK